MGDEQKEPSVIVTEVLSVLDLRRKLLGSKVRCYIFVHNRDEQTTKMVSKERLENPRRTSSNEKKKVDAHGFPAQKGGGDFFSGIPSYGQDQELSLIHI